jgi:hypothetical protein
MDRRRDERRADIFVIKCYDRPETRSNQNEAIFAPNRRST